MFFWSIPSNQKEIITNTPIGAKSIRYLFFENKNGQLFHFGDITDCISISIDNHAVCRDMMLLPFCTETPDRMHRFDWKEIALSVGMNVHNSQVKISGLRDNDFNIVFVCDTQEIQRYTGVDFVENKIIRLRRPQDDSDYVTPNPQPIVTLRPIYGQSDKEIVLSFDKKPIAFFAYPFYTRMNDGKVFTFNTERHILFDITGADTRILPEKMELFPFSASTKIAWSKCTWVFDEESANSLLLNMIFSAQLKAQLATGTLLIDNNQVKTIDIAFSFLYKKI